MRKTILISGASTGIGRKTAQHLSAQDPQLSLILAGRNEAGLNQTRASLTNPDHHQILILDQSKPGEITPKLQALKLDTLTAVIANAGLSAENKAGPGDRWQEILDTNLSGTYFLVSELIPRLAPGTTRHIILISSLLAQVGVPGFTAYSAAKAGLLGLMRSWSAELAPQNILVNAICPGWVKSERVQEIIETHARENQLSRQEAEKSLARYSPLQKMAETQEVAELVSYLLHQNSATGQTFNLNNGSYM
jgi:NAD(P)-dependent dehydrogenase (short-subunit alcohol dehydrogenase family)